jgi:hypothetical protein
MTRGPNAGGHLASPLGIASDVEEVSPTMRGPKQPKLLVRADEPAQLEQLRTPGGQVVRPNQIGNGLAEEKLRRCPR